MKLSVLACAWATTLACAACSQGPQTAVAPASSASAAGTPAGAMTAAGHAATTAAMPPAPAPTYLHDLLQRLDFVKALDALHGAQGLPPWVRKGGTATPAQTVQVDGKPMLLATACKPHDCPTERVALLYDAQDRAMWGLFAQRPEDLTPAVDPDDSSQDQLTWLGAPDQARRELLRDALYAH